MKSDPKSSPPTTDPRQLGLYDGPKKRKKSGPKTWSLKGGDVARVCPQCGCGRESPCRITLPCGATTECVPAGVLGLRVCSACGTRNASKP